MIKLIAIDVDGTLLNSKHELTQENKNRIQWAEKEGITIALASGRPLNGLFDVFKQLELDSNKHYLIGFNGAVVAKTSDYSVIFERAIELELAKTIIRHVNQFPLTLILSRKTELIVQDANGFNVQGEAKMNGMSLKVVDSLVDYIDYQPNKLLISGEPSLIDQYHDAIQAPFIGLVDFVKSAPFYLEIIVKDTNKGSSLDYLTQSLGLTSSEVMAIGDNYNDLSMIEYAGCGVAMGQSDDFIKSKAQFISLNNDENGVAYAIQNVIQKQ